MRYSQVALMRRAWRSSVCNVDELRLQSATESGNRHMTGQVGQRRGYTCMWTQLEPHHSMISNSTEEGQSRYGKCAWVLHFGGNNLRNGANYALDEYRNTNRKSHLANRMVPSTGATLRLPECQKSRSKPVEFVSNGSHIALSRHLYWASCSYIYLGL